MSLKDRRNFIKSSLALPLVGLTAGTVESSEVLIMDNQILLFADFATLNNASALVYIAGRSVIADGGEGYFYWDSNRSKKTADGGIVIDPDNPFLNSAKANGQGCWIRHAYTEIKPEMFGALADGVSPSGSAINKCIDYINSLPKNAPVILRFSPGIYMITDGENLPYPSRDNPPVGTCRGIKKIEHDFVTIMAYGAIIRVPSDYKWSRLKRGGDANDHFASGICVTGNDFKMFGGLLDGNLESREINRGPKDRGFGGEEFGLCMRGNNWYISDAEIKSWGTDCLLIMAPGKLSHSVLSNGRRNNISVVAKVDIEKNNPVIIENCKISNASQYSEKDYNAPGSGIHIESEHRASVLVDGCLILDSRRNSVRLSNNAENCILRDTVVNSDLEFQNTRNGQLGGHLVKNIYFQGISHVKTLYGNDNNKGILFDSCIFEEYSGNPILLRANGDKKQFNPDISVVNSIALKSKGFNLIKSKRGSVINSASKLKTF